MAGRKRLERVAHGVYNEIPKLIKRRTRRWSTRLTACDLFVSVCVCVSDPEKTLKEKQKKKGNNTNSELYKIENEEAAQHL